MHAIWELPELVVKIMDNLRIEDIVRTTRVCRLFWSMAVPSVWKKIAYDEETAELFKFFSIEDSNEDMAGKHWLEATPASRYRLYASFVQAAEVSIQMPEDVGFWKTRPLSKIFPNLRELRVLAWVTWSTELQDVLLEMLGCPALQKLDLSFDQSLSLHLPHLFSSLVPKLHAHRSDLRSFQLHCNGRYAGTRVELRQILDALPALRVLDLRKVKISFAEVWEAASQLGGLKKIVVFGEQVETDDVSGTSPQAFPSLEVVDLGVLPVRLISPVLTSIHGGKLASLRLFVNGDYTDALGGTLKRVERFQALQTLSLILGGVLTEWDDLVPALSCRVLRKVVLEARGVKTWLTDQNLELLARAWPLLEEFEIRDRDFDEEDIPSATLNGLACLAKHCPSLKSLNICVDARAVKLIASPAVGKNLRVLNLQSSMVGGENNVEEFIAAMWPHHIREYDD